MAESYIFSVRVVVIVALLRWEAEAAVEWLAGGWVGVGADEGFLGLLCPIHTVP